MKGTAIEGNTTVRSPAQAVSGGPTGSAYVMNAVMVTAESAGATTVLLNITVSGVEVKLAWGSRGIVSGGQMSVS